MKLVSLFLVGLALQTLISCTKSSTGTTSVQMSGVVQLGRVSGASVNIYKMNSNGTQGDLLGSAETRADGSYSLSLGAYAGPVIVEALGGTYIDEATGASVSNNRLLAILPDLSSSASVPVTALSHLLFSEAVTQLNNGNSVSVSVDTATNKVAETFGLQVSDLQALPADLTDAAEVGSASNSALRVAFKLSVISEMVDQVNGASAITSQDVDAVLDTLALATAKASGTEPSSIDNDLLADRLDGSGNSLGKTLASFSRAAHLKAMDNPNLELDALPVSLLAEITSFSEAAVTRALAGSYLLGDLNQDGTVTIYDAKMLVNAGKLDTGLSSTLAEGDTNGDGIVDILDVVNISSNYGQSINLPGDMDRDGDVDNDDADLFSNSPKFDLCSVSAPCTWSEGDMNGDGLVDILDAMSFMSSYQDAMAAADAAKAAARASVINYLPGDINQDGIVSQYDVKSFVDAAKYDQCSVGSPCIWSQGDFNEDGLVDILDTMLLSTYLGQSIYTPGDMDKDGDVDDTDGALLSASPKYDQCSESAPCTWDEGDFNGDGLVDILDITVFTQNRYDF